MTVRVMTSTGHINDHVADKWHVDDCGFLHIVKQGGGNVATYSNGNWSFVDNVPREVVPAGILRSTSRVLVHQGRTFLGRGEVTSQTFGVEDEDGFSAKGFEVRLDPQTYIDMGGPKTITVAVQPGNRLNDAAGR